MKFKQLIFSMLIRVVLALIVFYYVPTVLNLITNDSELLSQTVNIYRIIFSVGIVTMIILETIFIGSDKKYEWHFIFFSIIFLALIFYKNFSTYLILTIVFLLASFFMLYLKIPLRRIISKKI